jgi:hypothetical protein
MGSILANTFTVKPIISNKALLANVLAFSEVFGNDLNAAIPTDVFSERLRGIFFEKMELLKDKDYLNKVAEALKGDVVLINVAKKLRKSISIAPFMENIGDSIDKEYITFTDVAIAKGEYAFMLSAEFCLAQFVAAKKVLKNPNLELQKEGDLLFLEFKVNAENAQQHLDYIASNDLSDEYKDFSLKLMDQFLRDGVKKYKTESFIKALINGGYGNFVIVDIDV